MSIFCSKSTPLIVHFDVDIEVNDTGKEKSSVTLAVSDFSEATEDKVCEMFRDKLQSLFDSARTLCKSVSKPPE